MTTPYRADHVSSLLRPAEVLRARAAYEQWRIEEASECVPLENLALSPQCGFASVGEGNLLSPDDQWRKLELLVDTARRVWG
jgi:methionine synthase II (cobalamin-independent)